MLTSRLVVGAGDGCSNLLGSRSQLALDCDARRLASSVSEELIWAWPTSVGRQECCLTSRSQPSIPRSNGWPM
jgi:hypothetical protein